MRPLTKLLNVTFGGDGWENSNVWDTGRDLAVFGSSGMREERIGNNFAEYARLYKGNSTLGTVIGIRMAVFSEVRYLWQKIENGVGSNALEHYPSLRLIEQPWPNGTTGELGARMEQDNSIAGNHYSVVSEDQSRLRRASPQHMRIVTGSPSDNPLDLEAKPVGYIYDPGGGLPPTFLTPARVLHYSPLPDPDAQWRGMSWMTSTINEILGDTAAIKQKTMFFKNARIVGERIVYDPSVKPAQVKEYADMFEDQFGSLSDSYKTLHIGGGADPKPAGANLKQLDLKSTQGSYETRIAAASGMGAVLAQLSEGLGGSSLGAGKFPEARKRSETIVFRPLWRIAAASLQSILKPPSGDYRLTYDTRDVAFLRDDAKDEAAIKNQDAVTIKLLIEAGFEPASAVKAVQANDMSLLVHTGLVSVQLQAPGSQDPVGVPANAVAVLLDQGWTVATEQALAAASANGNGTRRV